MNLMNIGAFLKLTKKFIRCVASSNTPSLYLKEGLKLAIQNCVQRTDRRAWYIASFTENKILYRSMSWIGIGTLLQI